MCASLKAVSAGLKMVEISKFVFWVLQDSIKVKKLYSLFTKITDSSP